MRLRGLARMQSEVRIGAKEQVVILSTSFLKAPQSLALIISLFTEVYCVIEPAFAKNCERVQINLLVKDINGSNLENRSCPKTQALIQYAFQFVLLH